MRKEITIDIPYVEKGKEKTKSVKINFVSNRAMSQYNEIMKRLNYSMSLYKSKDIATKALAAHIADKSKTPFRKSLEAKPFVRAVDEAKKKIKESGEDVLLADLYALIELILSDNGCEDKDLMSEKFWDSKTDSKAPWVFLNQAIMKDQIADAKKKRDMNSTQTS